MFFFDDEINITDANLYLFVFHQTRHCLHPFTVLMQLFHVVGLLKKLSLYIPEGVVGLLGFGAHLTRLIVQNAFNKKLAFVGQTFSDLACYYKVRTDHNWWGYYFFNDFFLLKVHSHLFLHLGNWFLYFFILSFYR